MPALLDTNVVSELARPNPESAVMTFLKRETMAHISVVTLHELVFGAKLVSDSAKTKEIARLDRID